jgi:hypothetical protein
MTYQSPHSHNVDPKTYGSFYIDGQWISSARLTFMSVVNPATEFQTTDFAIRSRASSRLVSKPRRRLCRFGHVHLIAVHRQRVASEKGHL